LEIESSIIAAQNALAINPAVREPQKEADTRQQQIQRQDTEYPRTQVVVRQGNPQAFSQAEKFREQQQSFYDQPDKRSSQAISAYQSLAREQLRSEIQQKLGVDTYV
jgi:hypothetical protein